MAPKTNKKCCQCMHNCPIIWIRLVNCCPIVGTSASEWAGAEYFVDLWVAFISIIQVIQLYLHNKQTCRCITSLQPLSVPSVDRWIEWGVQVGHSNWVLLIQDRQTDRSMQNWCYDESVDESALDRVNVWSACMRLICAVWLDLSISVRKICLIKCFMICGEHNRIHSSLGPCSPR